MKKLILLSAASLYFLFGCAKVELNGAKSAGAISSYDIAVNDTVQLMLDSNPTTGYSWGWLNQNVVSIVTSPGSQYTMDKTGEKGVTGRGGKELWRFIGVKNGADTIKLGYRRPWESVQPLKTMEIFIRVR